MKKQVKQIGIGTKGNVKLYERKVFIADMNGNCICAFIKVEIIDTEIIPSALLCYNLGKRN